MKRQLLSIAMLVLTGLTVAACAGSKDIQLTSSGDIPAATSIVKLGTNDNGNTTFDLKVEHLALPERVDAGATVYVVWMRGRDANANIQNMGALIVDDNLNGSFSGVTPLKDFELFVTAEPTLTNTAPTGKALLYSTLSAN